MTNNVERAAKIIADALRPALLIADGIGRDLAHLLADAGLLMPDGMNTQTETVGPALPDGWRLADHEKYGRVVVTRPAPDRNGNVPFVLPDDDSPVRHTWHFCFPDALTYTDIDQEDNQ